MGKLNWNTERSDSFTVDRLNLNRLFGYLCHDVHIMLTLVYKDTVRTAQ